MNSEFTHILIVDDEAAICKILEQYLKKRGYTISSVQSVEQAFEIIDKERIDLVVTDIKMPGLSGVDLLKMVKKKNPTIPVLMTTGFPTLDTAIEALKLGAYDYLTKPFRLEEIGEKIRRAIISKQMEEESLLFSKLISLHEVTKVLTSTLDIAELDKKFLNYSIQMSKSDGGALLINDSDSDSVSKLSISEVGGNVGRSSWTNPAFINASRLVLSRGEPIVIDAGAAEPLGLLPLPPEFKSFISYPLKTPARTIGVLNLLRFANRDPFTNLDLETVNVLASQASISIENVR
ncbi:MAG: response regulator, partial [Fibrobacter sp.]|nr:response regulator [Fibrobacter sp.]